MRTAGQERCLKQPGAQGHHDQTVCAMLRPLLRKLQSRSTPFLIEQVSGAEVVERVLVRVMTPDIDDLAHDVPVDDGHIYEIDPEGPS